MVKYSFVLPAYKARFFRESLDSILLQTYKDFELIIVNDASPDDIRSIVLAYNDSRIRYYENDENIGGKDLVAHWNRCLNYAQGEYIILASDDDVYSPFYLENMNELVCKYTYVNVFRPRIQVINADGVVMHTFSFKQELLDEVEYMYYWMLGKIGSGLPYFIFKKAALLEYGGFVNFPLAWGSDDVTVIDLAKNKVAFHPEILFSFRMSGDNITSLQNNNQQLFSKLRAYNYFEKWLEHKVAELDTIYNNDKSQYMRIYYKEFMKILVQDLLVSSSSSAIIRNFKYFCKLKSVSVAWCAYRISHVLCKRVFNIK